MGWGKLFGKSRQWLSPRPHYVNERLERIAVARRLIGGIMITMIGIAFNFSGQSLFLLFGLYLVLPQVRAPFIFAVAVPVALILGFCQPVSMWPGSWWRVMQPILQAAAVCIATAGPVITLGILAASSHHREMTSRDMTITGVLFVPILICTPVSFVALWYAGKNSFNAAESHPWLQPILDIALALLYTVIPLALTYSGVALKAAPLWISCLVDAFGLATTTALAVWEIRWARTPRCRHHQDGTTWAALTTAAGPAVHVDVLDGLITGPDDGDALCPGQATRRPLPRERQG